MVDTNIVLYLLAGDQTLAHLLDQKNLYISFISELELLGYKNYPESEKLHLQGFSLPLTKKPPLSYQKKGFSQAKPTQDIPRITGISFPF